MIKDRSAGVVLGLLCLSFSASAQSVPGTGPFTYPDASSLQRRSTRLSAPSVAKRFAEIAYEKTQAEDVTGPQIRQAIIFLRAGQALDANAGYLEPMLLKLVPRRDARDYSAQVLQWLSRYVGQDADMQVVRQAIDYLLARADSREEKEQILTNLAKRIGNRAAALDSELATMLGLLNCEKGDFEAARFYLLQAYENNKYNKTAFAKLAELMPNEMTPAMYLEHLRLLVRENPLDIEAAVNFAQYAERLGIYEVAAGAYQYSAELFAYLYPAESLPANIYLPWAISCYNTKRGSHITLQIAKHIRSEGTFDILLEAFAGRAAEKIGSDEEANQIFRAAEQRAQRLLEEGPKAAPAEDAQSQGTPLNAKQFAWFYCFAWPDPNKALDWANKAYSSDPNSPAAAPILAYALAMNDQLEWAKPLIEGQEGNQIADLVRAHIQLVDRRRDPAIKLLKAAIEKDPSSLAAERARALLADLGSEYLPLVDRDVVLAGLSRSVGQAIVPRFTTPDKLVSVQFNIRGNEFSYGSNMEGVVAVINESAEPLVISDASFFRGNIRIDAAVKGDIRKQIPNLISRQLHSGQIIEPGRSVIASVELVTGRLRSLLLTYPQASLDIEFTLYLDPAVTQKGKVSNRIVDIEPVTISARRPRVELTGKYLRNRFNSISTGQAGQRIKTAQLFVGLLKEQQAMAEHGTLYQWRYADWIPALLTSALLHDSGLLLNPANGEWVTKTHTMAEMLSLPLDQELTTAIAKNLNNARWPVRLMALYLLAQGPDEGFGKVQEWMSEYDTNEFVREMAAALPSAPPSEVDASQAVDTLAGPAVLEPQQ